MAKPEKVRSKLVSKSGSVTIPSDIRREYQYLGGEAVDIEVKDGKVILAPHTPRCIFCDGTEDIRKFEGRHICAGCMERMGEEAKPVD